VVSLIQSREYGKLDLINIIKPSAKTQELNHILCVIHFYLNSNLMSYRNHLAIHRDPVRFEIVIFQWRYLYKISQVSQIAFPSHPLADLPS
jgi:hypothetical protein